MMPTTLLAGEPPTGSILATGSPKPAPKPKKTTLPDYAKKSKTFDPEGSGYDYATARRHGLEPDKSGHWPSRVPQTGQILKGRKHPTFHKTEDAEKKIGNVIRKGEDGGYFSNNPAPKPKKVFPTRHPMVKNKDGSGSNVVLKSWNFGAESGGKEVVIPTMVGGKQLTDAEAIAIARKHGLDKYMQFDTVAEANAWAEENHGNINANGELTQ